MDPQQNVAFRRLPDETRALFDVTRPVPQDVWFLPRQANMSTFISDLIFSGLFAGGVVTCPGACLLIGLTGTLLDRTARISDIGDVIVVAGLYLVLAGLVIIGIRVIWIPLWYEWLAAREQRAGVLRRGLFLTPDTMIIRLRTTHCDIIPRASIVKVERWGRRSKTWGVVYRLPSGKQNICDLAFPPFDGHVPDLPEVSRIRAWARIRDEEA